MTQPNKETEEVKDAEVTPTDPGTTDTENTVENKDGGEEMVSKAEAQKMADAMVAKKLKGMPSKEELAKYKEWQEAQKTDAEKRAEEANRYKTIEAENATLKQEKVILAKGVKAKDIDYVHFKVAKMDGEFEENLDAFLGENPEFLAASETKAPTDGVAVKRSAGAKPNGVIDALKKKHPELNL